VSILEKPINARDLLNALENVLRLYRAAGYSMARILETRYSAANRCGTVILDEGTIGRIDISGTKKHGIGFFGENCR